MYLATSAGDEAGPSAGQIPTNRLPVTTTTTTGRIRRGTKGKPEHGCIFCGKVYSRREHLKRHQSKHKTGAFPCTFPGCGCTFHNAHLLERHKRHEWSFPFLLPEAFLFRCPSLPRHEHVTDVEVQTSRARSSSRVTPIALCENDGVASSGEYDSCSPFHSHGIPVSISEPSDAELSPRTRFLQVPRKGPLNDTRGRGQINRPAPRNITSSPAIMQSTQYRPGTSFIHDVASPSPEYHHGFYHQTHEESQLSSDRARPSFDPYEASHYIEPVSLVHGPPPTTQDGWHDPISTHYDNFASTCWFDRHFSHPTMTSDSYAFHQHLQQQSINQPDFQGQIQRQYRHQHYSSPSPFGSSYLGERSIQQDVFPRHSTGELNLNLDLQSTGERHRR